MTTKTVTHYAPIAMVDVAALIEVMQPGVPYTVPDLFRRYSNLVISVGREPSSKEALGRALARSGCIRGKGDRRTWLRPLPGIEHSGQSPVGSPPECSTPNPGRAVGFPGGDHEGRAPQGEERVGSSPEGKPTAGYEGDAR